MKKVLDGFVDGKKLSIAGLSGRLRGGKVASVRLRKDGSAFGLEHFFEKDGNGNLLWSTYFIREAPEAVPEASVKST